MRPFVCKWAWKIWKQLLTSNQVGWFLRKLMTSTTVDTEYKLNEDRSTFTKVVPGWNLVWQLTFDARWPLIWRGQQNIQCPRKESSSQREVFQAEKRFAAQMNFGFYELWLQVGRLMETSGGSVVQEMRLKSIWIICLLIIILCPGMQIMER